MVGSEKTLPFKSLPMRRMGISLGMRPLLRTTCGGKPRARRRGVEGQFSTNESGKRKKEGHDVSCPYKEKLGCGGWLALGDWPGGSRGVADSVAVDDELDAAIALAAIGGVVGGDGLRFAEAARGNG